MTTYTLPHTFLKNFEADWRAAWPWLAPDSHAQKLMIDVARATRELERLYPPALCARSLQVVRDLSPRLTVDETQHPPEWVPPEVWKRVDKALDEIRVFHPLLMPDAWTPWLVTLLLLGDDLGDCPGWERQKKLVRRLRLLEEHHQARFEVGLWAGMRRAGVIVERIPEESSRTADFVMVDHGTRIALEAKAIQSALYHQNLQTLYGSLGHNDPGCSIIINPPPDPPFHTIRFTPNSAVYTAMSSSDEASFERAFGWPLRQFMNRWYAERGATLLFGVTHEVPRLGTFAILDPPHPRSWAKQVVERDPPTLDVEVRRALERAKDARGQVLAHDVDVRAAVLWVSGWRAPAEPASRVLAKLVARDPHEFEGLDWIILLNAHRVRAMECQVDLAAHRVPTSASMIDITRTAWYDGLRRWRLFA